MTVTVAILGGFAGIMQFSVVRPVHQCFDAQDRCIEDLATDTSEFHGCSQLIVYHFMYHREDVMQLVDPCTDQLHESWQRIDVEGSFRLNIARGESRNQRLEVPNSSKRPTPRQASCWFLASPLTPAPSWRLIRPYRCHDCQLMTFRSSRRGTPRTLLGKRGLSRSNYCASVSQAWCSRMDEPFMASELESYLILELILKSSGTGFVTIDRFLNQLGNGRDSSRRSSIT